MLALSTKENLACCSLFTSLSWSRCGVIQCGAMSERPRRGSVSLTIAHAREKNERLCSPQDHSRWAFMCDDGCNAARKNAVCPSSNPSMLRWGSHCWLVRGSVRSCLGPFLGLLRRSIDRARAHFFLPSVLPRRVVLLVEDSVWPLLGWLFGLLETFPSSTCSRITFFWRALSCVFACVSQCVTTVTVKRLREDFSQALGRKTFPPVLREFVRGGEWNHCFCSLQSIPYNRCWNGLSSHPLLLHESFYRQWIRWSIFVSDQLAEGVP